MLPIGRLLLVPILALDVDRWIISTGLQSMPRMVRSNEADRQMHKVSPLF